MMNEIDRFPLLRKKILQYVGRSHMSAANKEQSLNVVCIQPSTKKQCMWCLIAKTTLPLNLTPSARTYRASPVPQADPFLRGASASDLEYVLFNLGKRPIHIKAVPGLEKGDVGGSFCLVILVSPAELKIDVE